MRKPADFFNKYSEPLYALLRIVVGVLFACHGAQKLFGALGGTQNLQGRFLIAGIIEFAGGLLIALGLFTFLAAFISSGYMAVVYFVVHASHGFWPIVNHGELAVIYCFVFLYIAARGGGMISLDRQIWR